MTVEQIAEICHEALRKVDAGIEVSWARLSKEEKAKNTNDIKNAMDTRNVYPGTDASVATKLLCSIVRDLANQVEGYEDFGKSELVGKGEVQQEEETEDLAADPLRIVLSNQNPPYVGIKRGDKMLLSARLELGSKLLINGSLHDHRDYPHKDGIELGELV